MLMVVAFWFEVALARRAFVLRTIERPWRLMRTGTACIARWRGLFGTLLRLVSVFLAIRTLLARAFVLGMIRLARIAESALTRIMTGCTALGTDAVRTSCFGSVLARRIPCNTLGSFRTMSRVRQNHSDHRPYFDRSFVSFRFDSFLGSAAFTAPADRSASGLLRPR